MSIDNPQTFDVLRQAATQPEVPRHARVAQPLAPDLVAGSPSSDAASAVRRRSYLAPLTVCAAGGLFAVAGADALARSTRSSSQALFWVGLLAIFVPIVLRLLGRGAPRFERISLVVVLGLSLYLVKVLTNPFGFTGADELAHAPNVNAILRTHELFQPTSILPVTAHYPGLETVTAALASLSGLSSFGAGLVVVGAARLIMMLALFLLFETLSRSSRIAAVAAAIYATNSSFIFFGVQFSYESLALPLFVLVLFAVTQWRSAERPIGWAIAIAAITLAVVPTHHLTSYALCVLLVVLSLVTLVLRRRTQFRNPWPFALLALAATGGWLVFAASSTVGYLSPVLQNAFVTAFHTVSGSEAPRKLFHASDSGYTAPLLERAVGIGAIALMALALPFALRAFRRRFRYDPLVILFALASVAFFAVVALRLAPAAWETANRASAFLFIGLCFGLAYVALRRFVPGRMAWIGRVVTGAALGVVFAGGVIAGPQPAQRLSRPYRVEAGTAVIVPQGRQLAAWARTRFPVGARVAASDADARLLATYAGAYAIAGLHPDVRDILQTPRLKPWETKLLRENRLRYVVVDRRERSFDNTAGYFFGVLPPAGPRDTLYGSRVAWKFDRSGENRIYDSGTIIVFERGSASGGPANG